MWALIALGCEDDRYKVEARDNCPKVSLDNLAGRWIKVEGSRGDHTHRFEIFKDGEHYKMWNVSGGNFGTRTLTGVVREGDVRFTETGGARMMQGFQAGTVGLQRLYVEPIKSKCSLRIYEVELRTSKGKKGEIPRGGPQEYLEFPENVEFNFRPCSESLFLGPAAGDHARARKELSKYGTGNPNHGLGEAIPVGAFSVAEEDGPAECTYDFDASFDGRPIADRKKIPAGEVRKKTRHWYVPDWYAAWSGYHYFEMYRYRTCPGKERELIAVSCLEALLE